jgi:hypothetical protein
MFIFLAYITRIHQASVVHFNLYISCIFLLKSEKYTVRDIPNSIYINKSSIWYNAKWYLQYNVSWVPYC